MRIGTEPLGVHIKSYLNNLSERERLLLGMGMAALLFIAVYAVSNSVMLAFDSQSMALANTQQRTFHELPQLIEQHSRLNAQLKMLEDEYDKLTTPADRTDVFKILEKHLSMGTARPEEASKKPLGSKFEQREFSISRLEVSDFKKFVDALVALEESQFKFIVSRITLSKEGARLFATFGVRSINRKNS